MTNQVKSTEPLYKKREPIFPKLVHGKYRLIKWVMLFGSLAVYYGLPWVRWPRGINEPSQAVLVDFPGQRFYFFFIEIWPDELYYVTGLLVLGALVLFLVTAIWGRLWCGFTCPQTVWTDLFIAVERLVEGDRNKRLKLQKQKWTFDKIWKKSLKHTIWMFIAAATGGAWVLYFHDAPTIFREFFTAKAPLSAYLFFGILTFTTYSLAGLMREQVCTYMCPWPRIQAAMTDDKTFTVGYYAARGEPRAKHKAGTSWDGRGDCVDCMGCVTACPMGIDIRDGDQLECINCGLCIDACDDVMKRVGRPTGLIAFGADYREGASQEKRQRLPNLFRTRTLFYIIAVTIVTGVMVLGLSTGKKIDFTVERDRAPAFTMLSDGSLRNGITLRLLNKHNEMHIFHVEIKGPAGLQRAAIGRKFDGEILPVEVPGDKQLIARVFLTLPIGAVNEINTPITLVATDTVTGEVIERDLLLIGGEKK